jgi:hypothetical protein
VESIFSTTELDGGFSWSITTKLGDIIQTAETLFGHRDKSYSILGVEVTDSQQPQIWFPGNRKDISIQITTECIYDMNRAVYQAAHEVIHCLSPTGQNAANVLEEGLACYFSIYYTSLNNHGSWNCASLKYARAQSLFEKLNIIVPDIVRKVRQIQPIISLITVEDLLLVDCAIPLELASMLTMKFTELGQ